MTLGKTLEVAIWRLKVSASWEILIILSFNHRFSTETAILQAFWHHNQWMENVCKQPASFFFLFQSQYFNSPWKSSWNLRSVINQKPKLTCVNEVPLIWWNWYHLAAVEINWTCTASSFSNANRAQQHKAS